VFGFDFSPKKTRARPRRRRTPTLHYILPLFFSRTATIKTISDYVTTIIINNNNNIMWTRSARVQSSGRLLLSRIVCFYNTPTVIYPPGTTPPVQHNPTRTFRRLPVPHRKSTTTTSTSVCRKEIHLTRELARRFIIAQTAKQYNITCRHRYCTNITVYKIFLYLPIDWLYCRFHSPLPDLTFV